jgi:hypothetical protein
MLWNEIDHEMVRHKLSLISQEMQPKVVSEERRVLFECRQRGNSGAVKPSLVKLHEQLTDEWLERTYEAYCEVWAAQQKTKSADFVRAVFQNALVPLIAVRRAVIITRFDQRATHKCEKSSRPETAAIVRALMNLQEKWFDKLEIEAKTCNYSDSTRLQGGQSSGPLNNDEDPAIHSQRADQNCVPEASLTRLLMSSHNRDYVSVWEQIDQTLARLKLQEPSEKHSEEVAQERRSIEYEHRENRHAMIESLLKMVEHRADEWIGIECRIYCEVWKLQGQSLTANFLRTLRDNIVEPTVHARTSAERSHLIKMWDRCGIPGRQTLESQLTKFEHTMMSLEHRWKTRFEIAAKEWEHACDLPRTESDRMIPSTKGELSRDPSAGEDQRRQRDRQPNLRYRSHLKRAILIQLTKKRDATDLEICRALDADGAIDLPANWSIGKNRLFESVYMNPATRGRVESVISKVRADLRKMGLLE